MSDLFDQVTILGYYFSNEETFDRDFEGMKRALCETWRHCGDLRTVLVVNRSTRALERFASECSAPVEIQIETSLVPGEIHSMSRDCNGRLHARFKTPYVLVVQPDGYPLRSGLEEFVGKYDFIGAPYVRDVGWKRLICRSLNYWVSNGGFSLRSKKVCELAARYWREKYSKKPWTIAFSEDMYYTKTLPLRERDYRRSVRIADNREALAFSYDAIVEQKPTKLPFGFHRNMTLDALRKQFDF